MVSAARPRVADRCPLPATSAPSSAAPFSRSSSTTCRSYAACFALRSVAPLTRARPRAGRACAGLHPPRLPALAALLQLRHRLGLRILLHRPVPAQGALRHGAGHRARAADGSAGADAQTYVLRISSPLIMWACLALMYALHRVYRQLNDMLRAATNKPRDMREFPGETCAPRTARSGDSVSLTRVMRRRLPFGVARVLLHLHQPLRAGAGLLRVHEGGGPQLALRGAGGLVRRRRVQGTTTRRDRAACADRRLRARAQRFVPYAIILCITLVVGVPLALYASASRAPARSRGAAR